MKALILTLSLFVFISCVEEEKTSKAPMKSSSEKPIGNLDEHEKEKKNSTQKKVKTYTPDSRMRVILDSLVNLSSQVQLIQLKPKTNGKEKFYMGSAIDFKTLDVKPELLKIVDTLTNEEENKLVESFELYTDRDDYGSDCFNPTSGFRFINKNGKVISFLEICLGCSVAKIYPTPKGWNYFISRELSREIKNIYNGRISNELLAM